MTTVARLLRLVAAFTGRRRLRLARGVRGLTAPGATRAGAATADRAAGRSGRGLRLVLDPEVAHHLVVLIPRDALRRVGGLRETFAAAAALLGCDVDRRAGHRHGVGRDLAAERVADP